MYIINTLPLIENYQNNNLPATRSIDGYSGQLNKVLQFENSLLEKYDRKEKTEE